MCVCGELESSSDDEGDDDGLDAIEKYCQDTESV